MTTFHSGGARISITNFGDKVTIGGHAYVVIYSRVQVSNPTGQSLSIDPQASAGLVPLNSAGDTVQAHGSVNHDYAVAADRFGASYAWPTASALTGAGGFDQHFAHMRAHWNQQLAGIARIVSLPDASLADAYRTGFIYTQIIRSGNQLRTGANGYDTESSHDVIGVLANLFTQGYTGGAHGLLNRARYVIGTQTQYYSTAYNAGYGEWGLASARHRDQGILSYQFMISNGQSGPYSWWESQQFPNPGAPWTGTHPEAGNGSSPHAWAWLTPT